jgi:hypothetical protein
MANNTEQRKTALTAREAFEECFQMPPSIFWDGEQYSTLRSDTGALRDSLTHQGRWEGWQAALAQSEQAGEWVMVPKIATLEMIEAGKGKWLPDYKGHQECYQAMLSAAPAPKQDELAESSCTAEGFVSKDTPKTFVPCTPEEAAELFASMYPSGNFYEADEATLRKGVRLCNISPVELAEIINADRAKR